MKTIGILLLVLCLITFARARSRFFDRTAGEDPGRLVLARTGTIAGILLPINAAYPFYPVIAPSYVLGCLIFTISLALFFFSTGAHGDRRPGIAYSVRPPDYLVFRGPYRYIRHPIYTSYMLCWFGAWLIGPTVVAALLVGVIGYLYYRTVIFEERVIEESIYGEEYRRYKTRAGMFLPKSIK